MSLVTPASVQKLQTALHAKAKESPSFRFYAVYDKVYRKDVLAFAYECGHANGGAAGVDGQRFEDIEGVWSRAMVGRTGARAEKSKLSTTARAAGVHTEAGREEAAAVRSARDPGSGSGNGSSFGSRTYFRDRSAAGTVRLSARPQRVGRGESSPQADLCWP